MRDGSGLGYGGESGGENPQLCDIFLEADSTGLGGDGLAGVGKEHEAVSGGTRGFGHQYRGCSLLEWARLEMKQMWEER